MLRRADQSFESETPVLEIDLRRTTGVQYRPFRGAALTGRNPMQAARVGTDHYTRGNAIRAKNFFILGFGLIHRKHEVTSARLGPSLHENFVALEGLTSV